MKCTLGHTHYILKWPYLQIGKHTPIPHDHLTQFRILNCASCMWASTSLAICAGIVWQYTHVQHTRMHSGTWHKNLYKMGPSRDGWQLCLTLVMTTFLFAKILSSSWLAYKYFKGNPNFWESEDFGGIYPLIIRLPLAEYRLCVVRSWPNRNLTN